MLLTRLIHVPNRLIRRLNALNRRFIYAGMPDHIWRGEIIHQELVLVLFDALAELGCDARSGHLGVEVVGRDFGGGDEVAVFAGELLLDAAVEEEGHVGVFFGLGDVALFHALGAEVFGEDVAHVLRAEGDGEGVVGFVLRHCRDGDVFWVGEVWFRGAVDVAEELGHFADAVGAVVEEEEGVVVVDAGFFPADDDGF